MAKIYKGINLNNTNGGGSGDPNPPYTQSFTLGSWSLDNDVYRISIPEATHNEGENILVQVFELVSGEYRQVSSDIILQTNGNVKLEIDASPDLRFSGKVIIKGE